MGKVIVVSGNPHGESGPTLDAGGAVADHPVENRAKFRSHAADPFLGQRVLVAGLRRRQQEQRFDAACRGSAPGALIAEADAFVPQWRDLKLPDGRDRVVSHGHGPRRAIQTGIGPCVTSNAGPHGDAQLYER
jgi:hypothetical protein